MDFNLNELILGINLQIIPEDINIALIEATTYSTRMIVEAFKNDRVKINSIVLEAFQLKTECLLKYMLTFEIEKFIYTPLVKTVLWELLF